MLFAFALFTIVTTMPAMAAETVIPAPYTATYSVSYRGLNAGLLHFELRSDEPDVFVFESRAEPTLLARLVVGVDALERSVLRIDGEGVRPLSWFVEDGKEGEAADGFLEFSWDEETVSGTVKGRRIELRTEPGLQDRLSIQIAVMTALLQGDEPGTIPLMVDGEIKRYDYVRAGSGRVATRAGAFDTVLYESTRPGSSRLSRIWHAPELGYVPVRAEQVRNGRVETVMELQRIAGDVTSASAPPRSPRW